MMDAIDPGAARPASATLILTLALSTGATGFVVATPGFDLVSTPTALVVLGADAEGAPIEVARMPELPDALAMAVDGEIGLVAARDSVWVVDFTAPTQPAILAGFVHSDDDAVSSVDSG